MEQFKLLSMTAGLTVLVWASADRLVNEAVSVGVMFEVVPAGGAPGLIVESDTPSAEYELQISGPRKIVEEVQSQAPLLVRLPILDRPTGPATIRIDRHRLKSEMADQWKQFRKLTIVSLQPDTLAVTVDHWIERDVDIVLTRRTLAYESEPQFQPTSVTVRMRESAIRQLPDRDRLQLGVASDLERLLKERPAGQSVTVPLTLDPRRFGPGASLTPNLISVTATLKAERATAEIPTVPILFAVSSANLEKTMRPVNRDGVPLTVVTRTIKATGPTDAVNRLVRGTDRAYGIIQLKQDDLEDAGVWKVFAPEYHLPPGIKLAEEPDPVEFKLINAIATDKSD